MYSIFKNSVHLIYRNSNNITSVHPCTLHAPMTDQKHSIHPSIQRTKFHRLAKRSVPLVCGLSKEGSSLTVSVFVISHLQHVLNSGRSKDLRVFLQLQCEQMKIRLWVVLLFVCVLALVISFYQVVGLSNPAWLRISNSEVASCYSLIRLR